MISARVRATLTQQRLLLPSIIQLRRQESTAATLQQHDEESRQTATLVFLRHGQSTWNETPTFTGWCNPELTTRGKSEAIAAGQLLHRRGFTLDGFDRVYTSALQRSIETTELVLDQLDIGNDDNNNTDSKKQKFDSIIKARQLNERHYGALQGLRKDDANLLAKYGKEQIAKWRRDFYATPPPSTMMPTTHARTSDNQGGPTLTQPAKNVPLTESLQDCQTRVLAYWHTTIVPDLFQSNNEHNPTALLVGHANTLRALVSYLDNVPTDKIPHIHIPNSIPCIYHVNRYGRAALFDEPTCPSVQHANGKYGETHGLWMLSAENYRRLQDKIGGASGTFLHALFDAWDTNRDGVLSREEIRNGLRELKGDDDVVTAALAAKLLEEIDLDNSDTIDLVEFDSKAATAFQKFVPDLLLEST